MYVAGMVGGAHKVNKVIYGYLALSLFPHNRVSLSLELAGSRQKHFFTLVEYRDTVEVGSGSSFQPHVPRNKTQNIFSNTLAILLSSFLPRS